MGALTPGTGITSFRNELDQLFDQFLEPAWKGDGDLGAREPKLDMSETKDAIVVTAEVPGVDQKDIEVSLRDVVTIIKGEKQEGEGREGKDVTKQIIERGRVIRGWIGVFIQELDAGLAPSFGVPPDS